MDETTFWITVVTVGVITAGAWLLHFSLRSAERHAAQSREWRVAAVERSPSQAQLDVPGSGSFSVAAVGESHYVSSFESVLGPRTGEGVDVAVVVQLVREPDNPYDANAVGVYIMGQKVGHLSRNDALRYRAMIEGCHGRATCRGLVRGGWDDGEGSVGHYGVWLDLPDPEVTPAAADAEERAAVEGVVVRLRGLKSKDARSRAVATALETIGNAEYRRTLLLAASRMEVAAVLEKVTALKSPGVKRKHLQSAIAALESDALPDDLQAAELQLLKEALAGVVGPIDALSAKAVPKV